MKGYVYILQSQKNNTYYIGSTNDIKQRIQQHNSGNVKSTKYKRPYKLIFCQQFLNIDIAKKIERKIKNWKRKDYIEKIIKNQKITILGH